MHGYCEKCHRVRRVYVTPRALEKAVTRGGGVGIVVGICDECEEKDRARRAR